MAPASSLPSSSDPIADVVGLLRPHVVGGCLHAAGTWAVGFDAFPHVRFGTVALGACWLSVEGDDPVHLREGDFLLLGNPPRYVLGSAPGVKARSARSVLATSPDGALRVGAAGEEDTFVCGGHFEFDGPNAALLLDVLPRLVLVRADDPRRKAFASLSDLLVPEVEARAVGSALVIDRLAHVLFVHMLRAHVHGSARSTGWLGALRDDRIGAALRAVHGDMARRWTVEELAGVASMSRSAFSAAFKSQVGKAPLEYLIEWRMAVARDALRRNTHSISELTSATGYESESAFSTAFRRVVGSSPKQFRDAAAPRPVR